jgi:hypothetical protein
MALMGQDTGEAKETKLGNLMKEFLAFFNGRWSDSSKFVHICSGHDCCPGGTPEDGVAFINICVLKGYVFMCIFTVPDL